MIQATVQISDLNLALGYLLMLIPVLIFLKYRTKLAKPTVIAIIRMTIQLFLIGLYLKYLFLWDKWWLNLLWALVMLVVAAFTIGSRASMRRSLFIIPLFTALFLSMSIVDLYFFKVVLRLENLTTARYFIPITGMIMGNCLRSNVIALDTFYKGLVKDRSLYRFLLANGATREEALLPFMKQALTTAFNPTIANTAVMGLISLPGMMTGQILGGAMPQTAIRYQIMLVITIFVASILTVFFTIKIVNLFVFDKYDRLKVEYFNFKTSL